METCNMTTNRSRRLRRDTQIVTAREPGSLCCLAAAVGALEGPLPASPAIGAEHRPAGASDHAQHVGVAGDAEAQQRPDDQKPVPGEVSP
jgi:hypothetical protein